MKVTIDPAGRLVLPKAIRERAGIEPGMELDITIADGAVSIAPATREVRLVKKGPLRVAVPRESGPAVTQDEVWQTLRAIRSRSGGS